MLPTPEPQQTSTASQHIHSQSGSKTLPAAAHSKVGVCLPHHRALRFQSAPPSHLENDK